MDSNDHTGHNGTDSTGGTAPGRPDGATDGTAVAAELSPHAGLVDERLAALVRQARDWDTAKPVPSLDPAPWAIVADRLRRGWRRVRHGGRRHRGEHTPGAATAVRPYPGVPRAQAGHD